MEKFQYSFCVKLFNKIIYLQVVLRIYQEFVPLHLILYKFVYPFDVLEAVTVASRYTDQESM